MRKNVFLSLLFMGAVLSAAAQTKIGGTPGAANANAYLQLGDATGATKGLLLSNVALTATNLASPLGAHVPGMYVYNTATVGAGITAVSPGIYYNDGSSWIRLRGDELTSFTYGTGAPAATCNAGTKNTLYTDTADVSPTLGSQWVCDGTAWNIYIAPSSTEWYTSNTSNDAGGDKLSGIWRRGRVGIGDATFTPKSGLHIRSSDVNTNDVRLDGLNDGVNILVNRENGATGGSNLAYSNAIGTLKFSGMTGGTVQALSEIGSTYKGNGTTFFSDLLFKTTGLPRMYIDSLGRVGLNTTTPAALLHLRGGFLMNATGTSYTGIIFDGTASTDGVEISPNYIAVQRAGGTTNLFLTKQAGATGTLAEFRIGGALVGSIITNGTTTSFNTTSDERLKENIVSTAYGLSDVMKLKVYNYHYKTDKSQTQSTGFLAQELYKIYPQAVTVGGENEKTDPWQVDYSKLTPVLVKAIQDQQAQIDAQQKQINNLLLEVKALKGQK